MKILTKLVTHDDEDFFEDVLNEAIESIINNNNKIKDIKFSYSSYGVNNIGDKFTALIIYETK